MSWLGGWRRKLRALTRKGALEREMEREMEFHLDMEIHKNLRAGLPPEEARRRAMIAFGGVERYKQQVREGRRLAWIGGLPLDFKLGLRMLIKHPSLALVGGAGMAVGIAIGAVAFNVMQTLGRQWLPGDDAHRIVALRNVDSRTADDARQTHLHDLEIWRRDLSTVSELGAYRTVDRNLVLPDGRLETARVAEMTASGFRIAGSPALVGRIFDDAEERTSSAPVALIGHGMWRDRFDSSPQAVGRSLTIGGIPHVIIGVMPEGFAFPVNNRVWTPLRLSPSDYTAGNAPGVDIFARMAPGATLETVRAQAAAIGERLAAEFPNTHERVRPRVLPYALIEFEEAEATWLIRVIQVSLSLILVIIVINVAILVYARTANRIGEIAMRTALGGSRARVVAQLFSEALVLCALSAMAGLSVAKYVLRRINDYLTFVGGEITPYWWTFRLDWATVAYVVGVAFLSAAIVGILPALKATGRKVHSNLQHVGSGGTGLLLGRTWTLLIVAQVAMAVVFLPFVVSSVSSWITPRDRQLEKSTADVLIAELALDRQTFGYAEGIDAAFRERHRELQAEVIRRLDADPNVVAVVRSDGPPLVAHNADVVADRVTQPGDPTSPERESRSLTTAALEEALFFGGVASARVDPDFFEAFGVPILVGRGFRAADVTPQSNAIVVTRRFVVDILGGGSPLGRRIQVEGRGCSGLPVCEQDVGDWLEVVGVVPDFVAAHGLSAPTAMFYRPLIEAQSYPVTLNVRLRGIEPEAFAHRLREIVQAVDPMLRVTRAAPLDEALADTAKGIELINAIVTVLALSILLISAAGIAALMAFTVAQRQREIAIRLAIGAQRKHVVRGVFARASVQIGLGVTVGLSFVALSLSVGGDIDAREIRLLGAIVVVMSAVGFAATWGPARRALRIQPTEALKGE